MVTTTAHHITTADNHTLSATCYTPDTANGRTVVINAAMATQARFYRHYATYLAEQGFLTITYDYRGVGQSHSGSLRGFKATLLDWAVHDQTAMFNWATEQAPENKLVVVGHSLGGQILGLTPAFATIHAAMLVTVQNGYWRLMQGNIKALMIFNWYVLFPLGARLFGYYPGSKLGLGNDVPAQAAIDWGRACRSPQYLLKLYGGTQHDNYQQFDQPLRAISFTDDRYASLEAVEDLMAQFYPNAPIDHTHFAPSDLNVGKVGHFGFFRPDVKAALWESTSEWLLNA